MENTMNVKLIDAINTMDVCTLKCEYTTKGNVLSEWKFNSGQTVRCNADNLVVTVMSFGTKSFIDDIKYLSNNNLGLDLIEESIIEWVNGKGRYNYDLLDPYGLSFGRLFSSPREARKSINEIVKLYEKQGYYLFKGGRINLSDLTNHCTIRRVLSIDKE